MDKIFKFTTIINADGKRTLEFRKLSTIITQPVAFTRGHELRPLVFYCMTNMVNT